MTSISAYWPANVGRHLVVLLSFSLLVACGGSPEQTVAPAPGPVGPVLSGVDTDGDMVDDTLDQCAATPSGYSVDADGCSVQHCREAASQAVSACFGTVAVETKVCYDGTGAACASNNTTLAAASAGIAQAVTTACATDAVTQAAGFGDMLTTQGLFGLLDEACVGNVQQMASRVYGGPHAKLLNAANPVDKVCLHSGFDQAQGVIQATFDEYAACILDATCDGTMVEANRAARDTQATSTLTASCPTMRQTMGSTAALYVQRANAQARCMVAEGHAATSNVALDCGPDNSLFANVTFNVGDATGVAVASVDDVQLGQAVSVRFGTEWGSVCADGSDYSVLMRLSPTGDIRHVVMEQEGGGVCLTPGDCEVSPDKNFESLSRLAANELDVGYHAVRADNPFANWSHMHQTYCTQDLHIGGGVLGAGPPKLGGMMHRAGAINVRTSTRFYRDLIWRKLRHTSPTGYLPTDPVVIFSGTSAGGYGVQYNLHYPLDELRMANTIGVPHVGFVVGGGFGTDISALFTGFSPEANWDTRPYQPPYCLEDNCSLTEFNHPSHAARLGATPLQALLQISSQHDPVQEPTQGYGQPFPGNEPKDWIDEVRRVYCQNQHMPYVFYHLGANTQARHDFINTDAVFEHPRTLTRQLIVNGTGSLNWLFNHTQHPAETMDRVEDDLTLPGVMPFACAQGPLDPAGDFDGDGVQNLDDICPGTPAGAAIALNGCPLVVADTDQDGIGDAFDYCATTLTSERANDFGCAPSQDDIDSDGVLDPVDNCPSIANPGQENADSDNLGDVCDS